MDNTIKMDDLDDLGAILFQETTMYSSVSLFSVARCQRFSSFALVTVAAEMQLGAVAPWGSSTESYNAWLCQKM